MIKTIKFKSIEEIKKTINECKVLHTIPEIDIEPESFYKEVMNSIGKPFYSEEDLITKNKTGQLWSDIEYVKDKSTSFSHSNTRQPFHTDGAYEAKAPEISFFYCIKQSKFGGATIFADTEIIIDALYFYDKSLLEKIRITNIHHFKGDDEKILLILDQNNNWNWNYYRTEKNELVEKFHYFLEEVIYKSGLYQSVLLAPYEAVFFWDAKVLHGRNAFLGERHLKKAGIYV